MSPSIPNLEPIHMHQPRVLQPRIPIQEYTSDALPVMNGQLPFSLSGQNNDIKKNPHAPLD